MTKDEKMERYTIVSAYINNQTDEAWVELRRRVIAKDAADIPDRFERLVKSCTDGEFELVMEFARRAGLFWHCESCGFDNDEASALCGDCRMPKPKTVENPAT